MVSNNALLVAGIYVFYLFDSVVWLAPTDILCILRRRQQCSVGLPNPQWRIKGFSPYLPNPLTPHRIHLTMHWQPTTEPMQPEDTRLSQIQSSVIPLAILLWVLMCLLLIGIPLALLASASDRLFLALLTGAYLLIFVMLVYAYRQRAILGATSTTIGRIAFHSLACPPFALNMIRELSGSMSVGGNPVTYVLDHLPVSKTPQYLARMLAITEDLLLDEDEGTEPHSRFTGFKTEISRLGKLEDG